MERSFWEERWRDRRIGFHEGKPNGFLAEHHALLGARRRVLVPLCGKAIDVPYLASLGHHVVGVELVESAVRELFAELGVAPAVAADGPFVRFSHESIEVLVGDFFAATREHVGAVNAIYDRGALVALPEPMRDRYAPHALALLAPGSAGLIVTVDFEPRDRLSPPHAITSAEIHARYGAARPKLVAERDAMEERERAAGLAWAKAQCWSISLPGKTQ